MEQELSQFAFKLSYRNGAEGFIEFCEDNVWVEITPVDGASKKWVPMSELPYDLHPETGKSYKMMWEAQKEILREALKMENGQFKYKTIIFCWMRGEGKSLCAVLIQLWKFCCFPRQQILLGANSKEQTQFVHYDVMRAIVLHSPKLETMIGSRNIREKGMVFLDDKGNPQSEIKPISSHTGLLSNINGYTFSDLFKMKNDTFFTELDGSTRGTPNSLGTIDSTVSAKDHILYHRLYQPWLKGEPGSETIFFSYRFSKEGKPEDYWNPNITQAELDGFRIKFPFGDFERFFLNTWEAAGEKVFTAALIEVTNYIGVDNRVNTHEQTVELIERRLKYYKDLENFTEEDGLIISSDILEEAERRLWPIEDVLKLRTPQNTEKMPEPAEFEKLSEIFDTDWALLAGLDRADPMKKRTSARTIVSITAKGLIGSRNNPFKVWKGNPPYFYILLYLADVTDHKLEAIKEHIQLIHDTFDGVDVLGGERWGAWDLAPWCEERDVKLDLWVANYDRQKAIFTEFYQAVKFGRFKTPPLAIQGSKKDDIFKEEADVFDHQGPAQTGKKSGWFGSPEKFMRGGVQDDVMFSIGGGIYAGRELGVANFRERKGKIDFGSFFTNPDVLGDYR